jgi:hypothetical protein
MIRTSSLFAISTCEPAATRHLNEAFFRRRNRRHHAELELTNSVLIHRIAVHTIGNPHSHKAKGSPRTHQNERID